jgi:hypothetical protein
MFQPTRDRILEKRKRPAGHKSAGRFGLFFDHLSWTGRAAGIGLGVWQVPHQVNQGAQGGIDRFRIGKDGAHIGFKQDGSFGQGVMVDNCCSVRLVNVRGVSRVHGFVKFARSAVKKSYSGSISSSGSVVLEVFIGFCLWFGSLAATNQAGHFATLDENDNR